MVTNDVGRITVPGIGINKTADPGPNPRTETRRKFIPKGKTREGDPVVEETRSIFIENGVLVDEIIVKAASCAGCGVPLKSDSEAASTCTRCRYFLCSECKLNFKCEECGAQSHPACGHPYKERFLCFYCWLAAMELLDKD